MSSSTDNEKIAFILAAIHAFFTLLYFRYLYGAAGNIADNTNVYQVYHVISFIVLVVICVMSGLVASHEDEKRDTTQQQMRAAFGAGATFLAAFAALSLLLGFLKGGGLLVHLENQPQTWFHVFLVYGVFGATCVANFYGGSG